MKVFQRLEICENMFFKLTQKLQKSPKMEKKSIIK